MKVVAWEQCAHRCDTRSWQPLGSLEKENRKRSYRDECRLNHSRRACQSNGFIAQSAATNLNLTDPAIKFNPLPNNPGIGTLSNPGGNEVLLVIRLPVFVSALVTILKGKCCFEHVLKGIRLLNCLVCWNVNWDHSRSTLPNYSVPHIWCRTRRRRRMGIWNLFCPIGFFGGAGRLRIFGLAIVARGPRCRRNEIFFWRTSR